MTQPFASYAASLTGTLTWGCGFTFSNNIVYTGGAGDQGLGWLNQNGKTISGTVAATISPWQFFIGSDTVNTTASGPGILTAFNILHAPSAGHTGFRTTFQSNIAVVGAPTGAAPNYVAGTFLSRSSQNVGGATGAYANYAGGVYAGNCNVFLQSGATFYKQVNSCEFDVAVPTGASTADKYGLSIVKTSNDAVRGAFDDSAIEINDQDGTSTTWTYGLSFGGYAHKWPFGTDSTLITAQSRQVGPASTSVALYGVDLTNVTFTTGGAGFLAPLTTPASSSATGKTGSIVWDANFIYICTATNTWKRAALSTF